MELAPLVDLADGIVDLVDTGRTLAENDLEVVEEISAHTARLIANRVAHKPAVGRDRRDGRATSAPPPRTRREGRAAKLGRQRSAWARRRAQGSGRVRAACRDRRGGRHHDRIRPRRGRRDGDRARRALRRAPRGGASGSRRGARPGARLAQARCGRSPGSGPRRTSRPSPPPRRPRRGRASPDAARIEIAEVLVGAAAVYAPGDRARTRASSVLMGVVPVVVAGVERVAVASPPGPGGLPHDVVLAAARIAGATEAYAMGRPASPRWPTEPSRYRPLT